MPKNKILPNTLAETGDKLKRSSFLNTKTTERDIQWSIMEYLLYRKYFVWRSNAGTAVAQGMFFRLAPKGCPDIIGILPDGRFLGIEVKKPEGVVSKEQETFISKINELGGVAFVARSIDDVEKNLKDVGFE